MNKKKYVLTILSIVFFSGIVFLMQSMEDTNKRCITNSLFKDKSKYEKYKNILAKMLEVHASKEKEETKDTPKKRYDFGPMQKLIGDMQKGNGILDTPQSYGLQKRNSPAKHETLTYVPSDGQFMEYLSSNHTLSINLRDPQTDTPYVANNTRNLSDAIDNFVISDFPTAVYDVLKNINIDKSLKDKINDYTQRNCNFQACQKLDTIALLPGINFETKKKLFLLFLKNRHVRDLKSAVKHFSSDKAKPSFFYSEFIDYCFTRYPSYTRTTLVNYCMTEYSLRIGACAILKAYKALQEAIDDHPDIRQYAVNNAQFLKLLLDYGVQFSDSIISLAIQVGNVDSLKILKEYRMNFRDEKFIRDAIKAQNFDCLSFIANQQNISRDKYQKYIDALKFNDLVDIDQEAYKALLLAHFTGNAQPLEEIILDKILVQKIDKKMNKINEIENPISAINKIDKIIAKLRELELLCLAEKYPNCLKTLPIEKMAAVHEKEMFDKVNNSSLCLKGWFSIGIGPGIALSLSLLQKDPDKISCFMGAGGISILALTGWMTYAYLKKRYTKYCNLRDRICLQKKINYLKGYLYGLQGNNNSITNLQEQNHEENVLKWHWQKDISNMTWFNVGLLPLNGALILQVLPMMCFVVWYKFSGRLRDYCNNVPNNTEALLEYSQERGKRDGFLMMEAFKNKSHEQLKEKLCRIEEDSSKANFFTQILSAVTVCSKSLKEKFVQHALVSQRRDKADKFLKLEKFKQQLQIKKLTSAGDIF